MEVPFEIVSPDYVIVRFTDQIYKIVRFNRSHSSVFLGPRDASPPASYDEKLAASFSRTRRVILELGLCNHWEWFFTCTLDPNKWDRYDLAGFNKALSQWIRDMRKKYKSKIEYLLIPEPHKDGAWHMHGLISGLPLSCLSDFIPGVHPPKLCNRGYKNWGDYSGKFGFCSLSPIRDRVRVGFYITKYITKDLCQRKSELGCHLYYPSQKLNRASPVSEVIGNCSELNSFLTHHYKFCSTGLTRPSDGLDWTFPLVYDNTTIYLETLPMDEPETRETRKFDRMVESVIQMAMEGFHETVLS